MTAKIYRREHHRGWVVVFYGLDFHLDLVDSEVCVKTNVLSLGSSNYGLCFPITGNIAIQTGTV